MIIITIEDLFDKLEADRVETDKERVKRYTEAKNARDELKEEEFFLTREQILNIVDKIRYLEMLEADACSKVFYINVTISEIKKRIN